MKTIPSFSLTIICFLLVITLFPPKVFAVGSSESWLFAPGGMFTMQPIGTPSPSINPYTLQTPNPKVELTASLTPLPTVSALTQTTPAPVPREDHPSKSPITASVSPQPVLTPSPSPVPISQVSSNSFIQEINAYRKSLGLSAVATDPQTCGFAATRAREITSSFNHDGFNNRITNNALPYPQYSLVTENIAMTTDPKQVVSLWIHSPGHAANMQKDTPYVCVEHSGDYYAYEGWKP